MIHSVGCSDSLTGPWCSRWHSHEIPRSRWSRARSAAHQVGSLKDHPGCEAMDGYGRVNLLPTCSHQMPLVHNSGSQSSQHLRERSRDSQTWQTCPDFRHFSKAELRGFQRHLCTSRNWCLSNPSAVQGQSEWELRAHVIERICQGNQKHMRT